MTTHARLVLFSLTLALAACREQPKLEELPPAPVINKFKASASLVNQGTKVTLEWDTTNAVTVGIQQVGVGAVAGVDDQAFGSTEATVNAQSLFVLSAVNKRGVKATALATVGVEGGSTMAFFAALPELINPGQSATLVWNTPGAKVITIRAAGGAALDLKGQGDLGSIQVQPSATTVFTLDADGTQKQATVGVAQAISEFQVDRTLAQPGQTVTLSWKTSGGTKLTISSPGRAALVTETDLAKIAIGSLVDTLPSAPIGTVVPYTLTLEGQATTETQTVSVALSNTPDIKAFTAPQYILLGQKFSLVWTTSNADVVELSTGGVSFWRSTSRAQATSGNLMLDAPSADTDYVLSASNSLGGAAVTRTVTVRPVGPVTVSTFTATPATVSAGGGAVTLAWNVPNARRLKISGSDGHTVATARGTGAGTGTAMAYPNGAITYTLEADNTLEAPVTATQAVAVTVPAAFGPASSDTVFAGNPINLTWTVGAAAQLLGFPHSDVVTQPASTGFVDISTTGTKLAFTATADDATQEFTPPDFESFLYGNRVSGPVTVSSNGFFVFSDTASTRATTVPIPNNTIERNFVAAFWTDLEMASVGRVFWQVLGEAPERVLVVQFDKVKVESDAASELTFQAKVHQTGVVTFEYKTLVATVLPAAVIGVQGATAGLAAGGAAPNAAITLFGPKSPPVAASFTSAAAVGGFLKLTGGYLRATYAPSKFVGAGEVTISEVLYQPNPAIGTTGEWFEVANTSGVSIDLQGWTIDFNGVSTHVIASPVPLGPSSRVVLGQSAAGTANDNVATAYQYGTPFSMPQPAGMVTITNLNYLAPASWDSAQANGGGEGISVITDSQRYLQTADASGTAPHALKCNSTTPFGGQTPLQRGSPGAISNCMGFTVKPIAASYFDISTTSTELTLTSGKATVALAAAPFPFLGTTVAALTASQNGWVTLTTYTGSEAITNKTKPSTTAPSGSVLAVFWDYLVAPSANAAAGVYSKRVAAAEDAANPGAHWIVQWHHTSHASANDDLNFQLKLFDTGVIEYHWATMTSGSSSKYADGNSATVWLEDLAGSTALVSSINNPVVLPNTALRFTPN